MIISAVKVEHQFKKYMYIYANFKRIENAHIGGLNFPTITINNPTVPQQSQWSIRNQDKKF